MRTNTEQSPNLSIGFDSVSEAGQKKGVCKVKLWWFSMLFTAYEVFVCLPGIAVFLLIFWSWIKSPWISVSLAMVSYSFIPISAYGYRGLYHTPVGIAFFATVILAFCGLRRLKPMIRLLLPLVLLLASPALASEFYTGNVERVVDGDTIVMQGDSIRIWGIDTPEKDEPGFSDASAFIEALTDGAELNCLVHYIDYFKRPVASCEAHGQDLGALMVASGMAKDYRKYSKGHYSKEQEQARESGRGLWGEVWD